MLASIASLSWRSVCTGRLNLFLHVHNPAADKDLFVRSSRICTRVYDVEYSLQYIRHLCRLEVRGGFALESIKFAQHAWFLLLSPYRRWHSSFIPPLYGSRARPIVASCGRSAVARNASPSTVPALILHLEPWCAWLPTSTFASAPPCHFESYPIEPPRNRPGSLTPLPALYVKSPLQVQRPRARCILKRKKARGRSLGQLSYFASAA